MLHTPRFSEKVYVTEKRVCLSERPAPVPSSALRSAFRLHLAPRVGGLAL